MAPDDGGRLDRRGFFSQGLQRALGEELRVGLGIRVSVELTEPGALPRFDHKAKRVQDERSEVPF